MEDNSIVSFVNYGRIIFDIKPIMKIKKLTPTKLVKMTGLHHQVINRYYKGTITRYDEDILAKLCYVLNCDISDIMYYEKNKKK